MTEHRSSITSRRASFTALGALRRYKAPYGPCRKTLAGQGVSRAPRRRDSPRIDGPPLKPRRGSSSRVLRVVALRASVHHGVAVGVGAELPAAEWSLISPSLEESSTTLMPNSLPELPAKKPRDVASRPRDVQGFQLPFFNCSISHTRHNQCDHIVRIRPYAEDAKVPHERIAILRNAHWFESNLDPHPIVSQRRLRRQRPTKT